MFNIFSHLGNANQSYVEIPSHLSQHSCHQESKAINADAREKGTLYMAGGNAD